MIKETLQPPVPKQEETPSRELPSIDFFRQGFWCLTLGASGVVALGETLLTWGLSKPESFISAGLFVVATGRLIREGSTLAQLENNQ